MSDHPLPNPKEEAFAQSIARGCKGMEAYAALYPKASNKTATEKASRWARRDNVKARIAYLKEQQSATVAKESEKASKEAARHAGRELKTTLLTMQRRRELLAERANRPKISESSLCSVLRLDAQLAGELIDKTDLTTDGEALPTAMPSISLQMPPSFLERRNGHN